jgi:sensor domain CHASE-containing protein
VEKESMRKILPLLVGAVIIVCGLSAVTVSCKETDSEIISINTSNIKIVQNEIQTQKLMITIP